MKKVPFFLSIICVIILIVVEIYVIILAFEEGWVWYEFGVIQGVIFTFFSYIYYTNFGRNSLEINKPNSLFLIISLIIVSPTFYFLTIYFQEAYQKNIHDTKISYIKKTLEEPVDWGDTEYLHVKFNLKTKIEDDQLQYILVGMFTERDQRINVERFNIELLDKNGFNLAEIFVNDWTTLIDDNGEITGVKKNGYFTWPKFESYLKIHSYSVQVIK